MEVIVNGLPNQRRDRVYGGKFIIKVLWIFTTTNYTMNVDYEHQQPLETAPGGYFDIARVSASANLNNLPLTTVGTTRWCFIPMVSALDLHAPYNGNAFYNIAGNNVVATAKTSFANVTGPDRTLAPPSEDNDFHLTFTKYNNRLLWAELLPSADFTGNEALRFDGSDDVVAIPNTGSYVNELNRPDFTIEAFIRPERPGGVAPRKPFSPTGCTTLRLATRAC